MTAVAPAFPRLLPAGERALLAEFADAAQRRAFVDALRRDPAPGQLEQVPAARTVLVRFDAPVRLPGAREHLRRLEVSGTEAASDHSEPVTIPVRYDGADLADVAAHLGISPDEVVRRHTRQLWTVEFTGFMPGFGYLTGAEGGLEVPRLPNPRTRIPAGSVGLADAYSGIYPRSSPGGWRLIGRTGIELWDPTRNPPALLAPGRRARFEPVDELEPAAALSGPEDAPGDPLLRVEATGPLAMLEDLGRPGYAALGVTESGAADRSALRLGNRLVGNPEDAAGIEVAGGGLVVRALTDVVVALTGAETPLDIDGSPVALFHPLVLAEGHRLRLGRPVRGVRSYLTVRGGLTGPRVFGSVSSSPVAGIGAPPLEPGTALVGAERETTPVTSSDVSGVASRGDQLVLRATLGPRDDWFTPAALERLQTAAWTVTPAADRVGVRLSGPVLERSRAGELPSEPLLRGAIQVPPSGQPVIFGPDHPTTGGYPVIAVVHESDCDLMAQAEPGRRVRFRVQRSVV